MNQKYFEMFGDKKAIAQEFGDRDYGAPKGLTGQAQRILGVLNDSEVLFAYYDCQDYSGDATVLYRHKGELYLQSGGHCSCNGLEGQWDFESKPVSAAYLRNRSNPIPKYYSGTEPARKAWDRIVVGL